MPAPSPRRCFSTALSARPKAGRIWIFRPGSIAPSRAAPLAAKPMAHARSMRCSRSAMADRRVTPARPDLAAAHLKGTVDAARFAEGEKFSIGVGRASLRVRPSDDAAQDSELLFGEVFTVYDRKGGWAWGQAANDLYVGYVKEEALSTLLPAQAQVGAL